MSSSAEYELERRRRREIQLQKLREVVFGYYQRYERHYDQLVSHDALNLIPKEMASLRQMLDRVSSNLQSDPEQAQYNSFQVRDYIYKVIELSKSVAGEIRIQKELEFSSLRKEQQQKENEKQNWISEQWRSWNDQAVVSFAMDELLALQEGANQLSYEDMEKQLARIKATGESRAEAWKTEKLVRLERKAKKQQITDEIEQVESIKSNDNRQELDMVLTQLREISNKVDSEEGIDNINSVLEETDKKVTDVIQDEGLRLELVKSIYKEIASMGFRFVMQPKRVMTSDGESVQFTARKPSGQTFQCSVKLDGKIRWKFDGYPGQECQNDIESLQQQLQSIYGMNLEEKKVFWENPDRISSGSVPLDHNNRNENY